MKKLLIGVCMLVNLSYAKELTQHSLSLKDGTIDYYKVGQGSPIVLLIGYGLTNNFWPKSFINCLSQEHTLYILNHLSAPKPDMNMLADEVYTFINKLNLDHPELIGWSMGGGIALTVASKYPHSVSSLGIVSSIVAEPSISQIVPPYVAQTNSDDEKLNYVFGNNIYGYESGQLLKYKRQMLSGKVFVTDDVLTSQKMILANWMANPENSTMVSHIRVPAKVVISRHDAILNPEVEYRIFSQYPKAKITIIDAGHASFYQKPDQVCKAVLD